MAASAVRAEYASAVYGNNAYDLRRVAGGYDLPYEEEELRQPSPEELARERLQERARERARERAQAKAQAKAQAFGVPILGILGAVAAAVLMIAVLMGYVELTALSGETSQVRNSIADLTEEGEQLKIQYESTFNMADVESYAVNILGMVKGDTAGQNVYTVYMADRAEILAEDETAGFLARITAFLKELPEYFS